MDNQHAIALLRRMQEPEAYEPQITAEAFEALGMAIKALEQADHIAEVSKKATQPDVPDTNVGDTISRQAAIDAFLTELTKRERKNLLHTWSTVEVKYFITEILEHLPSAQPDEQCDNCHYKHIWMTQRMNGNGYFGHGGATG